MLVLFRVAVTAGVTGGFDIWNALGEFAAVSAGGVATGLVFGQLLALALRRVATAELNIVGGMLGAWGAYIGGDLLHVSGVLSTVACGLVVGWKQHEVLPAKTRTEANAVWNVAVFLLESLIFVLIGLALRGVVQRLHEAGIPPLSLAVPAAGVATVMVVARFAWIIPTTYVGRFLFPGLRRHDPYPSIGVPVVMSWAGMRGVVSLAVALSLPQAFPARDTLLAVTLAVVLASILLQGTTLASLIRALRLGGFQLEVPPTLDEARTRARVYGAAFDAIRLASHRRDGGERHPRLLEQYGYRLDMAERRAAAGAAEHGPERRAHYEAVLAANKAARLELLGLHRAGPHPRFGAGRTGGRTGPGGTRCPARPGRGRGLRRSARATARAARSPTRRGRTMKIYLLTLGVGLAVGALYSLLGVRSPAPQVIALVGLLGILLGEQGLPPVRQILAPSEGQAAAATLTDCAHHVLGSLPGRAGTIAAAPPVRRPVDKP